eukprot:TRINITY_DN4097_c0_g1_i2.p1 TRINITY_DN4097_c0_g1~~TRINITY_DN4097_c0_g1_i2.p1  ORF type:complete len:266 (+),score=51.76 TRINITY_DN4097_c0_g1_i2:105-902(+)
MSTQEEHSLHEMEATPLLHAEHHKGASGKYIKSIIYGGLDGIGSVFVTVASLAGAAQNFVFILILGIAKLIAGAISMGVGDYLSTQAEVQYAAGERAREEWECAHYLDGEKEEMVELYVAKGLKENTAKRIVEILSKDRKVFVDIMMIEELGIMPDDEYQIPWKHGAVNFTSFMIFGLIPLLAYMAYLAVIKLFAVSANEEHITFYIATAISIVTMFFMGIVKAKFTGTSAIQSGLLTVLLGAFAGFVGFGTGWILTNVLRIEGA